MSKALTTKNVAAVLVAVALVFGFAFAFAAPAKADTVSDLQAQIQSLLAQISALQGSGSASVSMSASCHTFTRNHKVGNSGGEVMWIQQFLNGHGFQVAASGAGSPGNESSYFGLKTKAAVIAFQNKYAADILVPVGLSAGTGNWGPSSRAKANALCAGGVVTPGPNPTPGPTPTPTPTGGGLSVGTAAQPANSLAPQGAARVPFTTFTLTNSSGVAVIVNSVSVQRTGLANDAVFSGIVLVDENGSQLGNSRTLDSNHMVNAGDPFTIQPGQTKTITVAGNMAASLSSYSGQVAALSVIGINTSATVSGSLPITGASQTINSSLTIGTASLTLGPSDLNAAQSSVNIGTTANVGASLRVTAGAAEDIWVKSIRWNQSGSAASGDLANVVTVVNGTSYPTTLSADGKYYTTIFPGNGIQVPKGLNAEVLVKFDIAGGPARTANFDVYKATDIYVVGGTYGYGITPTASNTVSAATTASEFTTGTPFFSGSQFTISAGTVTSLSRANSVAAQNIVLGSPNQPLGGFALAIQGEPISLTSMNFYIATGTSIASGLVTSVRMINENGAVIAGPVDATYFSATTQKVAFTSTVTFPTGSHVYTIQGQLPTTLVNGGTLNAQTTPSTDWSGATGGTTGNTISLSGLSSLVTSNTMTVRAGATAISVSATPAAQTIVAGQSGMTLGNILFDDTQSGEDVRYTSAQFTYTKDATATNVTNCFAYDGATQLNNTAVNPTGSVITATAYTFTFNNTLAVPKGTVKTVAIKCDVPGSLTSGTFSWGVAVQPGTSSNTISGTGTLSTQTIYPTANVAGGNTMTLSSGGALTVTLDSSSPSYAIAAAGSTGVTLGSLRFTGTNEIMKLDRVGLTMSNSSASSSPGNITQVTLWDGATQVGTAVFAGTRFATSSIGTCTGCGQVMIPANGYKNITVKGDLAGISLSLAGTEGALIQVDYNGADTTGTRAIGQSSGSTLNQGSSSNTAVAGVRVFKSFPTVTALTPPSLSLVVTGGVELYRFSVSANAAGDVGLYRITANISTSTGSNASGTTTVTNLKLYGFTDSAFSSGVPGFISGLVSSFNSGNGVASTSALTVNQNSLTVLSIPAGQTYYFKVVGDIAQNAGVTNSAGSVSTKLVGDALYPLQQSTLMAQTATILLDNNQSFIWSPNATSTAVIASIDWTNGYSVAGLPAGGTNTVTLSKSI